MTFWDFSKSRQQNRAILTNRPTTFILRGGVTDGTWCSWSQVSSTFYLMIVSPQFPSYHGPLPTPPTKFHSLPCLANNMGLAKRWVWWWICGSHVSQSIELGHNLAFIWLWCDLDVKGITEASLLVSETEPGITHDQKIIRAVHSCPKCLLKVHELWPNRWVWYVVISKNLDQPMGMSSPLYLW